MSELAELAERATETGLTVAEQGGGVLISWEHDPYEFAWQTKAQARDLANKLLAAAPFEER